MNKLLKLLSIFAISMTTSLNIIACSNTSSEIKFNYQKLLSTNRLVTQTEDNQGNLYYATFDNPTSIGKPGEKIWKYNINSKVNEIYWENKNFKVGSFNMAIDNQGNIYLGSAGGVQILNNKNQFSIMPLVSNAITNIIYFKNNIYVTTYDGFYKYNTITKVTIKIDLPDNSIANSIFIDNNENIYLSIYKPKTYSALIIKKGEDVATPIVGDYFFNTDNLRAIIKINNKTYFDTINYQTKESKLYSSDLNNINSVDFLLDLSINTQTIFNINNKVGLIINDNNKNTIVEVLNAKANSSLEKKYEIKNSSYNKIIQNFKNLYLANDNKIDNLSW